MRLGVNAGIIAIRPLPRTRPVNVSLPVIPFVDAPGDVTPGHAVDPAALRAAVEEVYSA